MRKLLLVFLALLVAGSAALAASLTKKTARMKPVKPAVGRTAEGTPSNSPVLATLDGQPYTLNDWNHDLPPESRQAARTAADRERTLNQLFEARLLTLAAEKSGVADDSLTAQRLENARKQILINAYLEKVVRPRAQADTAEIAKYYDAHRDDYQVKESATLRHIQTETRAQAEDVREKLVKGEDFAALAKKVSTDAGSKDDGGSIGTVTHDGFFRTLGKDVALADTLLRMKEGDLSGPMQARGSWHIFKVDQHEAARLQPLDAVRDMIRARLEREKAGVAYRAHLEELRQQFHFTVNQNVLGDSALFTPKPEDLFKQAQTAGDPQLRIRLYQELLDTYPNSAYAEQARFMIGFVYSEELSDYGKAESYFKELIEKHPKSELVKSAQWMLENMRKGTPAFDLPDSLKAPESPAAPKAGK